jgi:hypothetical protein
VHSPDDTWGWLWSNWWSERRLQVKPKNSEKNCPSATLSHHKSHMTRSGFEPRTAAVGSQRLTAWAMERPCINCYTTWKIITHFDCQNTLPLILPADSCDTCMWQGLFPHCSLSLQKNFCCFTRDLIIQHCSGATSCNVQKSSALATHCPHFSGAHVFREKFMLTLNHPCIQYLKYFCLQLNSFIMWLAFISGSSETTGWHTAFHS